MAKAAKSAKAAPKAPTKTQVLTNIAEATELSKKEVAAVFDALEAEIKKAMSKKDGVFTIPGLVKIKKRKVPARKAQRKMVLGVMRDLPAKPASTKVRVLPLKGLKDMVTK